jgi:hypothetical protein
MTMPDLDDRLRAAVRDGARAPQMPDVMDRVVQKRAHRRAVRRAQMTAAGVAAVIAIAAGSIAALTGGESDDTTRIAAPPGPSSAPKAYVYGAAGQRSNARVHRVALDLDEGYVRGPLLVQDGVITAAAYDRAGDSFTVPPSRIIRFTLEGHVVDRVDLKGEILSLASGEGARWALTRDKEVLAPPDPEFRVKRIAVDGAVLSNAVPRGEEPAGDIFAGGGAVWLPVKDGVLRFDPSSGAFAEKVPLSTPADHRALAVVGKTAAVTDGTSIPQLNTAGGVFPNPDVPLLPPGFRFVSVVGNGSGGVALALADSGTRFALVSLAFERSTASVQEAASAGIEPHRLRVIGDRVWIDGVNGRPALGRVGIRLGTSSSNPDDDLRVERRIVVNAGDVSLSPVDGRTVVFTEGGSIYRARVPE